MVYFRNQSYDVYFKNLLLKIWHNTKNRLTELVVNTLRTTYTCYKQSGFYFGLIPF